MSVPTSRNGAPGVLGEHRTWKKREIWRFWELSWPESESSSKISTKRLNGSSREAQGTRNKLHRELYANMRVKIDKQIRSVIRTCSVSGVCMCSVSGLQMQFSLGIPIPGKFWEIVILGAADAAFWGCRCSVLGPHMQNHLVHISGYCACRIQIGFVDCSGWIVDGGNFGESLRSVRLVGLTFWYCFQCSGR